MHHWTMQLSHVFQRSPSTPCICIEIGSVPWIAHALCDWRGREITWVSLYYDTQLKAAIFHYCFVERKMLCCASES